MIEYIEKETARRIINSPRTKEQMLAMLEGLPPVTPKPLDDVLDKIRAEIDQMPSELTADGRRMIRRAWVFQIIDKYKAESEDKSVSAILDDMKSGVDGLIDDGLKMIEKRKERMNENT